MYWLKQPNYPRVSPPPHPCLQVLTAELQITRLLYTALLAEKVDNVFDVKELLKAWNLIMKCQEQLKLTFIVLYSWGGSLEPFDSSSNI